MVRQYPHTIVVSWKTEPVHDPDTGDYSEGVLAGPHTFECRAEPNSRNRLIAGNDGQMKEYAFDVYMPKTSIEIPDNADYLLNGSIQGKVKHAANGQLNSRIWL